MRRILHRVRLLVLIAGVMACLPPNVATALDFGDSMEIYVEDYVGETAYPTTPEVSTLTTDGLTAVFTMGAGPGPTLDGTNALVDVSNDEFEGSILVVPGHSNTFGARAAFRSMATGLDQTMGFNITAFMGTHAVRAGLVVTDVDGGPDTGSVSVCVAPGTDPCTPGATFPLSASEATAILGGAIFDLDLLVDRESNEAIASAEVSGFTAVTTDPLSLSLNASSSLVGILHVVQGSGLASTTGAIAAFRIYDLPSFSLDDMTAEYLETFVGETGTPTTPELDALSGGSVALYSSGNLPPPLPTISGDLHFLISSVNGAAFQEQQGVVVAPTPVPAARGVAARMHFDAFSGGGIPPFDVIHLAALVFDADGVLATADTALIANFAVVDAGVGGVFVFQLLRFDFATTISTVIAEAQPIPASLATRVDIGDAHDIAIRVDRLTDTVSAALRSGGEEIVLGPVAANVAGQALVSANAEGLALNEIPGVGPTGNDDLQNVRLTRIELFSDATAVPVLGLAGGAGLALALGLVGARRTTRRGRLSKASPR